MKWYEIIVTTTSEGTELIADAFFSIGCMSGVKIIDKNDILDVMKNEKLWDYIKKDLLEKSDIAKVSGFVSEQEKDVKLEQLKAHLKKYNLQYGEITAVIIDDEKWYESWKSYYNPIVAGKYVVVPKWLTYDNKEKLIEILMDPGMAFGTGEHESTQMCLKLMSELDFEGKTVIDVGTGSGILGIAAIKSNAISCNMYDIDSIAVKAAKENAQLNGVESKVKIELNDLLCDKDKKADIILANLTADILIKLCNGLINYINKGGCLVCSGIINTRKQEVVDTFVFAGFTLKKAVTMGEWNALTFTL